MVDKSKEISPSVHHAMDGVGLVVGVVIGALVFLCIAFIAINVHGILLWMINYYEIDGDMKVVLLSAKQVIFYFDWILLTINLLKILKTEVKSLWKH